MGDHSGHRERKRTQINEKIMHADTESISDLELLEALLFHSRPRQDVMPLAQSLLDRYGGVGNLLNQSIDELRTNNGVGSSTACLIAVLGELARRAESQYRINAFAASPEDVHRFLKPRLCGMDSSITYLVCLDSTSRILSCTPVTGFPEDTNAAYEQISSQAVSVGSRHIILARGTTESFPTAQSCEYTFVRSIKQLLRDIGIIMLDHIIFSAEAFLSFTRMGYITLNDSDRGLYRPSKRPPISEGVYAVHSVFDAPTDEKEN